MSDDKKTIEAAVPELDERGEPTGVLREESAWRFKERYVETTDDNGGVHINATIVTHAFYLAIEGGTNRTSGLTVQGVGSGSRDQIEKAFYRAFTQLMPADATFAVMVVLVCLLSDVVHALLDPRVRY